MKLTHALPFLLSFSISAGIAQGGDVAVIVNAQNGLSNVSSRELERIFRQEKQHWDDGKKIYLVMQESGSSEKELVLTKVYRMDEGALKKFWLQKMFKGEIASFPKTLSSSGSVKQFVGKVPNAIGFLDSSLADAGVKILRVDGKLPGEAGYPLSAK
jgi:ABC-type phosphate transport system substrate-binding protein